MLSTLLFSGMPGLRLERIAVSQAQSDIDAASHGRYGRCPCCHRRSRHVHSHYHRTVADCSFLGRRLTIHLRVRRFRCRVRWCARRVFTERLPALVRPWAQRTERQRASLVRHVLDLGGEAGGRHCRAEAMPVSSRTLLRLVRQTALLAAQAVRVLGVDDWSIRRGQRYGTILVNLETHRVIDLLPDHTAATLASWLQQHPEIRVISRDRAGAYAEGARLGAPQALQIADRFHLDKNVTDAFERYLLRHHRVLRQAGAAAATDLGSIPTDLAEAVPSEAPASPAPTTRAAQEAADRRARRQARYDAVIALHQQGRSLRAIAATTGLAKGTVQKFIHAGSFPASLPRAPRRTQLTPFLAFLQERWAAGCQNGTQLWRELRARGFQGGRTILKDLLHTWRTTPSRSAKTDTSQRVTAPVPATGYAPRTTCWLLLKEVDQRMPEEERYVASLLHRCPEVAIAQALVREFQAVIRTRDVAGLYAWLNGVPLSGIPEFIRVANGIWRDRLAVEAALTHEESQGQVEGFVNKLKCLKRCGYGRSGIDLLRLRLLLTG